jgi:hypothetical protein
MEAMLYDPGVESSFETVTIIDTHPDGFSVLIKYASEGSLPEEADLWDTPTNAWPYLLSVADMYQVERLNLHYASKMWDMASEEIVTSFLRWVIQANCTQLQDKCMSFLTKYSHMIGRLYALIIPNLCTISVQDYLKGCTMVPCSLNVLFKCF